MAERGCEACGYETAPAWAAEWRCSCQGCDDGHFLCVNCGFRMGAPTHGRPVWAHLDACPAEKAVAWALMGEAPERGVEGFAGSVFAVLDFRDSGEEAERKVLDEARSLGIPAEIVRGDEEGPTGLGLRLGDGHVVWRR